MRGPAFSRIITWVAPLIALLIPVTAPAFEIEEERIFGDPSAPSHLQVISTTDTDLIAPLINAFLVDHQDLAIIYTTVSSTDLMAAIYDGSEEFDIALSSAMDLQTKLSNDGYTQRHSSPATDMVPDWARWGDHLFAFTQESAAIVISPSAFEGLEIPRTRQELITLLRTHADRFRGRVGTYDIGTSGLGYLFATQDARTSDSYWRLTEIMGNMQSRLYCCSSDMLNDVASGEIAVAYNVLGSYAAARIDLTDLIQTIEPQDYTLMMLRTAAILKTTDMPEQAGAFMDHLLLAAWGNAFPDIYPFQTNDADSDTTALRPIRLGPGLLVYLDAFKRKSFLTEWNDAILQDNPG